MLRLAKFPKRRAGLLLFTENEQSPDFLVHPGINELSILRLAIQKSLCKLTRLIGRNTMPNDEYFKQQADRVRAMADKADPFTKKRLLELADRYDAKLGKPSRATRQLRLPDIADHVGANTSARTADSPSPPTSAR
jgi:hypothetical protein